MYRELQKSKLNLNIDSNPQDAFLLCFQPLTSICRNTFPRVQNVQRLSWNLCLSLSSLSCQNEQKITLVNDKVFFFTCLIYTLYQHLPKCNGEEVVFFSVSFCSFSSLASFSSPDTASMRSVELLVPFWFSSCSWGADKTIPNKSAHYVSLH